MLMNQSKRKAENEVQLNNSYYDHSILISNTTLSKIELFILTALSSCFYFEYYRNDTKIGDTLNIILLSLILLIFARLIGKILWGVKIESIFIVRALGLQTTTVYHSNFKSSRFIPWHSINDVIINEAIVMQKVIFYLAVLVKSDNNGGESIIPIFIHAQPRLEELKKIYNNIQLILKN